MAEPERAAPEPAGGFGGEGASAGADAAEGALDASAAAPAPAAPSIERTAGRGGLAIAFAKVSFILFGFAQQLILPRLLGIDGYGEVSRVLAMVGIVNNVIVATAIQGVSRAVSSAKDADAAAAFRRTLGVHAVVAVVASGGLAALAGVWAEAVGAPHVTTPLRVVALVVLLYGVYAPLVGSLNGRRRFVDQAGLDIGYGAIRMMAIAGGAILFSARGQGVMGAIGGFVLAAGIIVPIALTRSGLGRAGTGGPKVGEYLLFLLPLLPGQAMLNLLLQTDFMILSRLLGQAADATGAGPDAADRLVGVYRGVQLFAFLPYQMLLSISFVLFPMLARAHAEGDRAAVARFAATGVRLAFVITGLMCGAVSALAPFVLRFAFPIEIADNGGAALRVLALGMGAFAILGITCAALTSIEREVSAFVLTTLTVALVVTGCYVLIPRAAFGPEMLLRSALATSVALATAATAAGFYLRAVAGAFVAPLTLLRVVAATAAAIAAGSRLPWLGKPAVLLEVGAVAIVYVLVLVVTGELSRADLGTVRRALGRKS